MHPRKSTQVHSNLPSSMQSSAGLVSQEKRLMNSHMHDAQEQLNFVHSGSLSPGASTIAGSTDAQGHNIGALSRNGYRGRFYTQPPINDDIEKDSISNSDTNRDLNLMNRADQRNKKLSWQQEEFQVTSAIRCICSLVQLHYWKIFSEKRCQWILGPQWINRKQFDCIFLS